MSDERKVLCQRCSRRERCQQACPNLARHLETFEVKSLREVLLSPEWLERIAAAQAAFGLEPEYNLDGIDWDGLLKELLPRERAVLRGLFWMGLPLSEVARRNRIPYGQARRVLVSGMARLKRLLKNSG